MRIGHGVGMQQAIKYARMWDAPFAYYAPVPPQPEQKPTATKIEALLALCDKLAAEVVAAEEARKRLLAAVLNGE